MTTQPHSNSAEHQSFQDRLRRSPQYVALAGTLAVFGSGSATADSETPQTVALREFQAGVAPVTLEATTTTTITENPIMLENGQEFTFAPIEKDNPEKSATAEREPPEKVAEPASITIGAIDLFDIPVNKTGSAYEGGTFGAWGLVTKPGAFALHRAKSDNDGAGGEAGYTSPKEKFFGPLLKLPGEEGVAWLGAHTNIVKATGEGDVGFRIFDDEEFDDDGEGLGVGDEIELTLEDGTIRTFAVIDLREIVGSADGEDGISLLNNDPGVYLRKKTLWDDKDGGAKKIDEALTEKYPGQSMITLSGSYAGPNGDEFFLGPDGFLHRLNFSILAAVEIVR